MAMAEKATRQTILQVAANEIHENGFRATGLNDILSKTKLTKGAFYHHFKSKAELGLAVAREVIDKAVKEMWINPLKTEEAGIDTLINCLEYAMAANSQKNVSRGCPLCNLSQEMATQDQKICESLKCTTEEWRVEIERILKKDQENDIIRQDVDCKKTSFFVISSVQGAIGLAKSYHDPQTFRTALRCLIDYLHDLKA